MPIEILPPDHEVADLTDLSDRLAIEHLSPEDQQRVAKEAGYFAEAVLEGWPADTDQTGGAYERVTRRLGDIVGVQDYYVPPELSDAYRLFTGRLFENVSALERKGDVAAAQQLVAGAYDELFSMSPNIASYSGTPDQQFRLVSLAQATPLARGLAEPMVGELAYNTSFGYEHDILSDTIKGIPAIEQLQSLRVLNRVAGWAASNGDWAEPAFQKVAFALNAAANDELNSQLVRKAAMATLDELEADVSMAWIDLDELPVNEQERLLADRERRQREYEDGQQALRQVFPRLDDSRGSVVRLASDCAAISSSGVLDSAEYHRVDAEPVVGRIDSVRGSAELGLDAEQSLLLNEIHRPTVRRLIEEDLGVGLQEISLAAQLKLLQYMGDADTGTYGHLTGTIRALPENDRSEICEAFLSLEHGGDLASSIVNIAEHADISQTREVFGIAQRFRENTHQFSSWFKAHDPEFAAATEKAMNERLADVLATIEEAAVHGSVAVDLGVGGTYKAAGTEQVLADLRLLDKSLTTLTSVMAADDTAVTLVTEPNGQFTIHRFNSPIKGQALSYVRPEGAKGYDRNHEYGNSRGVEASISFIVNPVDPHRLRSDKDPDGVSFRFDREGRRVDESPFSPDRDPTREDGLISVDISSVLGKPGSPAVRTGGCVAAGNIIRARRSGRQESLHHNTHFFDQEKYGRSYGFADIGRFVQSMAEAKRLSAISPNARVAAKLALQAAVATDRKSAA